MSFLALSCPSSPFGMVETMRWATHSRGDRGLCAIRDRRDWHDAHHGVAERRHVGPVQGFLLARPELPIPSMDLEALRRVEPGVLRQQRPVSNKGENR
jgi:hypothetical protein